MPPFVRGMDGRIYRSRPLTHDQRRKRDSRIRLALEMGWTVAMIVEQMAVSRGVVWSVAEKTPHRRKRHKYSQRAWKSRSPSTG